jgi:hypothetical protein
MPPRPVCSLAIVHLGLAHNLQHPAPVEPRGRAPLCSLCARPSRVMDWNLRRRTSINKHQGQDRAVLISRVYPGNNGGYEAQRGQAKKGGQRDAAALLICDSQPASQPGNQPRLPMHACHWRATACGGVCARWAELSVHIQLNLATYTTAGTARWGPVASATAADTKQSPAHAGRPGYCPTATTVLCRGPPSRGGSGRVRACSPSERAYVHTHVHTKYFSDRHPAVGTHFDVGSSTGAGSLGTCASSRLHAVDYCAHMFRDHHPPEAAPEREAQRPRGRTSNAVYLGNRLGTSFCSDRLSPAVAGGANPRGQGPTGSPGSSGRVQGGQTLRAARAGA